MISGLDLFETRLFSLLLIKNWDDDDDDDERAWENEMNWAAIRTKAIELMPKLRFKRLILLTIITGGDMMI